MTVRGFCTLIFAIAFPATGALAQEGGRQGIAFVQAPEMSSGVCTGKDAAAAFDCARKQCVDGGGTDEDCLEQAFCFPARFSVDGFVELPWADDRQPSTYLRRANLTFGVDLFERVGLQGTVGYAGGYDYAAETVSSGRLTLQQLAIMARPLDDLYVGAVLNEVWDLTGSDPAYPAFSLQPRFVVVWNRCCWALYGSWDSKSGAVSVTLTTPGATQGVGHVFDTGWIIPGREP